MSKQEKSTIVARTNMPVFADMISCALQAYEADGRRAPRKYIAAKMPQRGDVVHAVENEQKTHLRLRDGGGVKSKIQYKKYKHQSACACKTYEGGIAHFRQVGSTDSVRAIPQTQPTRSTTLFGLSSWAAALEKVVDDANRGVPTPYYAGSLRDEEFMQRNRRPHNI
ncbi:hypothetical protein C8Q74DRAFT_1392531 [Fomes fomentarius]|nr:hypothetical protein C8Q74DRAFT_1392531 [Fomes fomentarius]